MNRKLAIKGHATRGKEVIELLEMMGGNSIYDHWKGDQEHLRYFINKQGNIDNGYLMDNHNNYKVFTLEGFLEKYPFKVGDKVFLYDNITEGYVNGMKWDEDKGTVEYCVYTSAECWCDVKELLKWNANDCKDRMEEIKSKREYNELRMPLDDDDKLATEATIMGKKILPPDGYLVGKITQIDNGMLVEYVKKKPVYPKTYKGCCDILLIPPYYNLKYHTYEHCYNEYATSNTLLSLQDKLNTLGKLIICRDAYWKIAGEQMGLDKPWEPDFTNDEERYGIYTTSNKVVKDFCGVGDVNIILTFPTEEMRDTFYENFKDLIGQCKTLL